VSKEHPSFTDTLISKVDEASTITEKQLYEEFKNSKTVNDREAVYAKLQVLDDIAYNIREAIRRL